MIKVTLQSSKKGPEVKFVPSVTDDNKLEYFRTLLNTFPSALLSVVAAMVPYLRPATELERENHCYIFREGEEGKLENALYKQRKYYYDILTSIFQQILSTAFADVEYIDACSKFQQELAFGEDKEAIDMYNTTVAEVATEIRTNFDKHLKEILDEAVKEDQRVAEQKDDASAE